MVLNTFRWTTDVSLEKKLRVAWWLDGDGAIHRTECDGTNPAPTLDEVVADGTDPVGLASIDCPATRCTIEWTASGRAEIPIERRRLNLPTEGHLTTI